MLAYNSFSSIAEKQKGLENLIKFSYKKSGFFLLLSHLSIPFFCSYFTCRVLAFLAFMLPSCLRWVISPKYKISLSFSPSDFSIVATCQHSDVSFYSGFYII